MWLFEYLQLVYPYFAQGRSETEFVPGFFTEVMDENVDPELNPFYDYTPDFLKRVYEGTKRVESSKFTLVLPKLSQLRMRKLVDRILNSDAQFEIIDDFKNAGFEFNSTHLGDDLCALLKAIVKNAAKDRDNPSPAKSKRKAQKPTTHGFAATAPSDIFVKDGRLYVGADSVELPKGVNITANIAGDEARYVEQLCGAYSEEYGRAITPDNVRQDTDCGEQFAEQRINFYSADALRVTLEHFPEGDDEFTTVKDETYTGVSPVWRDPTHRNGYVKLLKTLQQAAALELRKSKAAHTTGLFGQSEMAGVCHMLVNDQRLWWVKP